MTEFAVHVGHINELYKDYWSCLNYEMREWFGDKFDLRISLSEATKAILNDRSLHTPISDFVAKQVDVEYHPEQSQPIYADNRQWYTDTWLLRFDSFERDGQVYSWVPDVQLKKTDKQYDYYFSLLWKQIDLLNSDSFLQYHFEEGNFASRSQYCKYLRTIKLKHSTILPDSPYSTLIEQYEKADQLGSIDEGIQDEKKIIIQAPKITRRESDNYTVLNLKQTQKLIKLLRTEKVILATNDLQTEVNIAKAWQAQTGYHYNSLRNNNQLDTLSKSELENLGKVLAKIKMHVDSEIAQKRGGKK